ncbi:SDR family oxidoreductase [Streptomyces sp. CS113]|uniref:SDR family oxidoreductase n=1 Tax=Streptomyces sp. CS113 TaxID=1982761 RepID=UPI00117F9AC7|nr:hypothetical protein [Streptomyces sp. CS113]
MKIVVVGGRTLVGDALVRVAVRRGHEVRVLCPAVGAEPWAGQDLDRDLHAVRAVIDVAVCPDPDEALRFHRACTVGLLNAGTAAGVAHHVLFNLTGRGPVPEGGLFRAKAAQEDLVRRSSLPHTVVRATRLFDFLAALAALAAVATPADAALLARAAVQPRAMEGLAEALADIAAGPPANTVVELGGFQHWGIDHFLAQHLTAPRRLGYSTG